MWQILFVALLHCLWTAEIKDIQCPNGKECPFGKCILGYELDENGECVPCERGYFRSRGMPACQQCISGKTTADVAATSEEECSLDICQPGMYVDGSTELCVMCPKGTYQNKEDRMTECIRCPQETTTKGLGATSLEECSNPCFVDGQEHICQANAACVYHEECDTFGCECLLEYVMKHSTSECLDPCENFCENGGTCLRISFESKPWCICPHLFFGVNCREKFDKFDEHYDIDSTVRKFVYVASCIAVAVIVIIMLVLLVRMICARSRRKEDAENARTTY